MLKIIVDGSADMPEGWAEKYQFSIVPIPIQVGDKTYYQGVDITSDQFYKLVENPQNQPKTAAPSPTKIKELIEELCDIGDTVLSINVSGKMSATVSMVKQAADDLKNKINVIPFDSDAGSAVLAMMAREARLRDAAGDSVEEILEVLSRIKERVMVVLTLDSLEFAYRSGRVGKLQAALTSFLKIKPIVTLKEGMLNVSDMVRTRKKSLQRIVEKVKEEFGDEAVKVAIVHSQDQTTADILKEMLENVVNSSETIFTELSISVAANLGPKTVGIVAIPDKI
jgi:DegV family protein with EDD domain